jgi:hypothetical protein
MKRLAIAVIALSILLLARPTGRPFTLAATPVAPAGGSPTIEGCPVFPPDNPWNRDISNDPVDPDSVRYIAYINSGGDTYLHADFGSNLEYGIPYNVVPGTQPKVPIDFVEYGNESDPGPYPIPKDAQVEFGSDAHLLVIDKDNCMLYELYHARYVGPGWEAGSGALFNLRTNDLRPETWTSTDEAGLPVFPGLVRYDEVMAGAINHALRFTVWQTQRAYISPARHYGSSNDQYAPPMGLRLRLKASYDISRNTGQAKVVLAALKKYGMMVADTGTSWFISGATDARWDDDDLDQLKRVPGSAFEVVKTGPIILYPY